MNRPGTVIAFMNAAHFIDHYALVGRYTSDEWRSRAFAARYFIGFTAAGASVGLVAALHARGGFALMLQGLALLSLLVILAALIFPLDRSSPSGAP